jgi:rod shape determining protein RodA
MGQGFFRGDMTLGERPLVPEAYTDFIFTSWAERTGFLGTVIMLIVMMFIPLRSLQISLNSRDRFASLLGSGIAFMYFYHIIINMGIALGLLPVTGLPLSFMSYGGSHLVICMAGIGIILNIHKRRFAN